MVEINNNPVHTALRAQQQQAVANTKLAAQTTTIDQKRNAAVVAVRAASVPQTQKTVRSDAQTAPRGTYLDITA